MSSALDPFRPDDVKEHLGRVLVVEDDCSLCQFLVDCLELAGYQSFWSTNGLDGWRTYESERPNLAVVDLEVPVISGYRLLSLLRASPDGANPPIPVIVITGHDFEEVTELVVGARPDAFLQKPFSPEQLLTTVGHLLRRQAA